MAKLWIELRVWLKSTAQSGTVQELAEALQKSLYELTAEEEEPIVVEEITYMVKREEERYKVDDRKA